MNDHDRLRLRCAADQTIMAARRLSGNGSSVVRVADVVQRAWDDFRLSVSREAATEVLSERLRLLAPELGTDAEPPTG